MVIAPCKLGTKWLHYSTLLVCVGALVFGGAARAADEPPGIRLAGIVRFGTNSLALLENASTKPPQESLLAEGESERRLSLIRIDPAGGKVEIHDAGAFRELSFASNSVAGAQQPALGSAFGIRLQQAALNPVLDIYQRLVQRTCVRSPLSPPLRLDLEVQQATSEAGLAKAIEAELAAKGIFMQPERNKFIVIGTRSELKKVTPELWDLAVDVEKASSHTAASPRTGNELIPAGLLDFRGADVFQLESIYQSLANRTLLRPSATPLGAGIHLRTATALTREETLFAFNLVLAFCDVSVRPAGEKFLLVFPTAETNMAARVLARKLPEHVGALSKPVPAGALELWGAGVPELKTVYEALAAQPVSMDAALPNVHFLVRNQTELTSVEALHALDLLLAWHGLAVTPQGEGKGLKLVRLAKDN